MPKKILSNKVTHAIGISRYILDKHKQHNYFKNAKHTVINNAFSTRIQAKKRIDNKIVIGFIGRIAQTKGVELLIEAAKILHNQNQSITLIIAGSGDGTYIDKLQSQCENIDVKFIGKSEPDKFYPIIDILAVPSTWNEPFGRVVIEAYAYGKPVVANNVGGLPELITEKTGKLAVQPTSEAFAAAITEQIKKLRSNPEKIYQYTIEKSQEYTPRQVAKQYITVYSDAISTRI